MGREHEVASQCLTTANKVPYRLCGLRLSGIGALAYGLRPYAAPEHLFYIHRHPGNITMKINDATLISLRRLHANNHSHHQHTTIPHARS